MKPTDQDRIRVREFEDRDGAAWDAFVQAHPDGTFFHLCGWRNVLERSLGHRTHYALAEDSGGIRAVLPLGRIRSRMFGDSLISTPFCVYGGALALDRESGKALEAHACELAERLRVDQLELRNIQPSNEDWPSKSLYVAFRREIEADPEANLRAIPRKQRAVVRKGIKSDMTAIVDPGIDRLWAVYSESVRNLGTPVFPKRYLQALHDEFGDRSEVLTIEHDGRAVASVLSFYFRDEVLPYYGGGIADARRLKANDYMYWELMCRAVERGVRVFDFGRSKNGVGSYSFKKHWGFEPRPLHYEYHLVRAKTVPEVNPLNPKYRLFVDGWKRLPLPLSRIVGPWIARNLG